MIPHIKPIFIFSSSWRSGSTLLQRYITSSGEVLVWGETGGALNTLRDALAGWEQITADGSRRFCNSIGGNGEQSYNKFISTPKTAHARQWIANLTPPYAEIVSSMRSMLIDLYGKRAKTLGYQRFGIKETRCDLTTAHCLQALFPDAKFVFLIRNPLAVILSIKRRNWMGRPTNHATLRYYSEHWRILSAQFRKADFGMILRYEDFISDSALRNKLMDYLEIDARPPEDFTETSRVDWTTLDQSTLTLWERGWLHYWLSEEMKHWGY
jgi:hypothetical protein